MLIYTENMLRHSVKLDTDTQTTHIRTILQEQINLRCQLSIGSAYQLWFGVDWANYFQLIWAYRRLGPASGQARMTLYAINYVMRTS